MNPHSIVASVAHSHGLPASSLRGPWKSTRFVLPRHEAMYLIRAICELSYPDIARALGRRDHTTAMNGVRRTAERLERNPDYLAQLWAMVA